MLRRAEQALEQHGDDQHGHQGDQRGVGGDLKLFHTLGARLKPMMATMAPLTTGGMTMSIHFEPAKCTSRPIRASSRPVTHNAEARDGRPLFAVVTAVIGAMKPKDEPR